MSTIDRIAPTRRPESGRVVMKQRWSQLLFMHWEVPAEILRPLLPTRLELDTFEGRAFVGVVPFAMCNVRPVYLPAFAPLSNFLETNVRTYVHFEGRDPGVWFFSLDAANSVAVRLARSWFKLPYHYATMRTDSTREAKDALAVHYRTERHWPEPLPGRLEVHYSVDAEATVKPAVAGSLEHFLAERYVLYAQRSEALYLGRVHHTPYPLRVARVRDLDESLVSAAKIERPAGLPPLAHYAEGVNVDIYGLNRIV